MPKREAENELRGDESRRKNAHQNFRQEYYTEQFLCVVRSTQSAKHVKCSAYFSSWDFSQISDVEHNIALSAADHDICSGAHFRKSELQRRIIYMYATLKI